LRARYPQAWRLDLLKSDELASYTAAPSLLRERLLKAFPKRTGRFAVIDEIQKVPPLLDEVHHLIEEEGFVFALCGSSARKIKRGHANLLGGRALRRELFGLTSLELGEDFALDRILNNGYLPAHYGLKQHGEEWRLSLRAYHGDYLKEEVMAEGLVRRLPPFSTFLESVALSDGEVVSYESFARDCGVSAVAVKNYFEILADTLIGRFLPAYRGRPKRRVVRSPKFYLFDVGLVNHLAKRGRLEPKSELYGKAFENWVFHELSASLSYSLSENELSYWKLDSQAEVDFIVGPMRYALEAKAKSRINDDDLKGLRELVKDFPKVARRAVVSLELQSRRTADGIEILSVNDFRKELAAHAFS
jgi:predicted AAA+ superfamily ATPase